MFDKLYIWHRGLQEQLKGYKRCMMLLEDAKTKKHASLDTLNVSVSMMTTLASAISEVDPCTLCMLASTCDIALARVVLILTKTSPKPKAEPVSHYEKQLLHHSLLKKHSLICTQI